MEYEKTEKTNNYGDFISALGGALSELEGEVGDRNALIELRDGYVYGDFLDRAIDIPIGHDNTPVNWLRRTVEIHKIQFMGRPFQVISTYDTKDTNIEDQEEAGRLKIENKKEKEFAELRRRAVEDIIKDNGGHSLFMEGAESASAIGDWVIKAWYDEDNKKYVLSPVEAVENCYALWSKDDFREYDGFAYVYQISKQQAKDRYDVSDDVATSAVGNPFEFTGQKVQPTTNSTQQMVTVLEFTGKLEGWGSSKGKLKKVPKGKENEMNVLCIGNDVKRILDQPKKLPKYYIFHNKKERRRAWGKSDLSDAAILINGTYVETLSDWRTVSAKVNFPKFRAFNFGADVQMPKYKGREIQLLPMGEGQDIMLLNQGDSNQLDFKAQLDELKEQFVRETGISRVLFDDPSITLNSNQALLTSMKPTSDIAESKKQLWGPVLTRMFEDAIATLAEYDETFKDINEGNWSLRLQWPSMMQKEDPILQQMLLNRFNAKTISFQSYLEAQGEDKEEIDRIRDELSDPVTAAILGNQVPLLAQQIIAPPAPQGPEPPKVTVSLRGELSPAQEAELAAIHGFNSSGEMGPQGESGNRAYENADNKGFLEGNPNMGGTAITQSAPASVNTPANNTEGSGVVSQPGSGATSTSPQGALNQANQQSGG